MIALATWLVKATSLVSEFVRDQVKNLAAKFDHADLKHVEPNVKQNVEGTVANSFLAG